MAVIDILPHCVSSVYFMYDSKWERFSLGKLSALREITLAKEMYEAGAVDMKWLYMGMLSIIRGGIYSRTGYLTRRSAVSQVFISTRAPR